jgi:hypothetical protein
MPHPMCACVDNEDVIVVFVPIWVDDVSGNSTKAYNKHINMYMQTSNLPGNLLNQEFFCLVCGHFAACNIIGADVSIHKADQVSVMGVCCAHDSHHQ